MLLQISPVFTYTLYMCVCVSIWFCEISSQEYLWVTTSTIWKWTDPSPQTNYSYCVIIIYSPALTSGNNWPFFYHCNFFTLRTLYKWTNIVWKLFDFVFFHSAYIFEIYPKLFQVSIVSCFLLLDSILLCQYSIVYPFAC